MGLYFLLLCFYMYNPIRFLLLILVNINFALKFKIIYSSLTTINLGGYQMSAIIMDIRRYDIKNSSKQIRIGMQQNMDK